MAKAQRVWGTSETNQRPDLEPEDMEVISIFNILGPGEGRISATDILAMCEEIGVADRPRMVRLVKFTEGHVQTHHAEEREKKMKKNG